MVANLMLLRFLISHLVPLGEPGRFTDTFASHLSEPLKMIELGALHHLLRHRLTSSMFPSLAPTERNKAWRILKYSAACSGVLKRIPVNMI